VWPLMISKAVSTGMFLRRFSEQRSTPYLAGAAVDGSILVVTAKRFFASRRR
jgi:hypothetical protein